MELINTQLCEQLREKLKIYQIKLEKLIQSLEVNKYNDYDSISIITDFMERVVNDFNIESLL